MRATREMAAGGVAGTGVEIVPLTVSKSAVPKLFRKHLLDLPANRVQTSLMLPGVDKARVTLGASTRGPESVKTTSSEPPVKVRRLLLVVPALKFSSDGFPPVALIATLLIVEAVKSKLPEKFSVTVRVEGLPVRVAV